MDNNQVFTKSLITEPLVFCEYAGGACDQTFINTTISDGFFVYPNNPEIIACTIEESIKKLKSSAERKSWLSWKDLDISGEIIFCKICKALRFTKLVIADVTTLNFNLLFEIGYAIGLGKPVLPIKEEVVQRLVDAKVPAERLLNAIELLLWFGFLGIYINEDEERYSYRFQHDMKKMQGGLNQFMYCIHPGFRKALGCQR